MQGMLALSKIPKTQSTSPSLWGLYGQTLFNSLAEPTKWAYVLIQQWNRIKQCINTVQDKSSGREARAENIYQQRVLANKKKRILRALSHRIILNFTVSLVFGNDKEFAHVYKAMLFYVYLLGSLLFWSRGDLYPSRNYLAWSKRDWNMFTHPGNYDGKASFLVW